MIDENRIQKAIDYLLETDFTCAEAKVNAERLKYVGKRKRAHVVLVEVGTGQVKDAKSEIDAEVIKADDLYFECLQAYEQMSAKRKTEQLVIEVWRTEQANLRKG